MSAAAVRLAKMVLDEPERARVEAARIVASAKAQGKRKAAKSLPRRRKEKAESLNDVARRVEIRADVAKRSGGYCERQSCRRFMGAALHWDHFWGRARAESIESTWMLCPHCDLEKTDNKPSRIEWLNEFWDHCEWFAYVDEQEKVNRAITLQKAKHPAPPPERTTT